MANHAPHRSLVFALAGALAVALLAIAFLLGRESSRQPERSGPAASPSPATPGPSGPTDPAKPGSERPWPKWADLEEWDSRSIEAPVAQTDEGRVERRADGRVLLSNRNLDGSSHRPQSRSPQPAPAGTERATSTISSESDDVIAYFERVDAIRSSTTATDPKAFAMDLIKATMNGSTEGFDELIDETKGIRAEMGAIDPPTECRAYHVGSVEALQDAEAILDTMKNAIESGNIQALTQITQRAGALQAKAETLEALRTQILEGLRR